MSELKELLKAGDPAAHEPPPTLVDVQRMRRNILTTLPVVTTSPVERSAWWPQPLAVAAALALTIAAAVGVGRQLPGNGDQAARDADRDPARLASSGDAEGTTRQLHFEAPGGTQIIWVFDEEFKL